MDTTLFKDILVIFGLSIAVLLLCHALKLPSIVGFILTGVLSGPHGFSLINQVADVESLANIGIILLLFSIGMEFSIKKLKEMKRFFFLGGILQVGLTVLAGFLIGSFFERPYGEALFLGFILSLSSTAIVLRILEKRAEMNSPQGKIIVSILIFQDFIAIPMMLALPFLSSKGDAHFDFSALYLILKGILLLIVVFISAQSLVPHLMFYITKTRSRELFLLSILTICFSVAFLAEKVGLSLSLGAFLAGLIISETEYSHQAISDILPFKDIFTSVFFVSVGMLLDLAFVMEHPLLIFTVTLAVLIIKSVIATLTTLILRMPMRTAVITGLSLSQVGEFSLILVKSGFGFGLGDEFYYQLFLSVALFSMAITPTLMNIAPLIGLIFSKMAFANKMTSLFKEFSFQENTALKDHLIIVGFGVAGRYLAKGAKETNIPYFIIEMNPVTVKQEKAEGEPIHYGDGTHETLLRQANIKEAKAMAVLINDPAAALRMTERARKINPNLYIITRVHYQKEIGEIYSRGADDVVSDEIGSSIEIFRKVLSFYEIEQEKLENIVF